MYDKNSELYLYRIMNYIEQHTFTRITKTTRTYSVDYQIVFRNLIHRCHFIFTEYVSIITIIIKYSVFFFVAFIINFNISLYFP